MRNLVAALVVVGLLAAPSFGAFTLSLQTGGSNAANVNPGQVVTVNIMGQADGGFLGLAASTTATGDAVLGTPAAGVTWSAAFPGAPAVNTPAVAGTPGANGTVANFGSVDFVGNSVGASALQLLGSYQATVSASATAGQKVTLKLVDNATMGQIQTSDYAGELSTDAGVSFTSVPLVLTVVPEPATMALLALGGLLIARRRHA